MNKFILIIYFALYSTIQVTAQITEDVAKAFFNSAYNAYCEHDLKKTVEPWTGPIPELQIYEERGARMLSKSTWQGKCLTCYWAAMVNVEIQWDFDRDIKKYRFETYCYGPKSCRYYKMGRSRSVPSRDMS